MKNNSLNSPSAPVPTPPETGQGAALVPKRTDWLSIGQFAFSLLGAVFLLGISLISLWIMFLRDSVLSPGSAGGGDLSPYLFASGLLLMGVLLIPSAVSSGRRLFSSKSPGTFQWGKLTWMSYLFPLFILLGFLLQMGPVKNQIFLPLVHVAANGLAVLWLLSLVHRGLPPRSAQRISGALAGGLAFAPLVAFTVEIILLIGIGLLWVAALGGDPAFRQELLDLASRIQTSTVDLALLEGDLGRLIARPGVIGTLFLYLGLMIPVVEELIKPAAAWLMLRRKLRPWEGFLIGATSGAGYALFENLTIGSVPSAWGLVTVLRLGTAAVHVFASGLIGWGLISGFTDKKLDRLLGSLLAGIILHGAWNGLNILSSLAEFSAVREALGRFGTGLAAYAPAGLVVLAAGSLLGILKANSSFRRAIIAGEN